MRIHHIRHYRVLTLLLIGLWALSACDTAATPPPVGLSPTVPSAPTGASISPINTPQAGITPAVTSPTVQSTAARPTATPLPPKESFDTSIVYGDGDFDFPNPAAGLVDLAAYQANLTIQFDGKRNGQVQTWSKIYVMRASQTASARLLTVERSQGTAKLDAILMAELDGASYAVQGKNPCTAKPIEPGSSLANQFEPAASLGSVIGAVKAGSETINGVASDHYTFDQRALGEDGLTQATGSLWVASKGGYLVKYVLTRKGQPDYFGAGIEGTETIDYELVVSDKPAAIDVPATCPPGMVNAPLLPDAAKVDKSLGMLSYQSATMLANAAMFYQQELPKQGWVQAEDPAIATTSALLSYKRGNLLMSVSFTAIIGGGTTVTVALARLQE